MFRSYLVSAFRSIRKYKKYSATNIFGLGVGMAASLFIFQYVYFERNYDHFNKNHERLFRVIMESGSDIQYVSAAIHSGVAPGLKDYIPEIENYTRLVHTSVLTNWKMLSYKPASDRVKSFNETKLYLADAGFFRLFSYGLLEGNLNSCLSEPNSIVLSKALARKYMGNESPLGKTMLIDGWRAIKVTGVFDHAPENSHIQFDALLSMNTLGENYGFNEFDHPEFYNYVLMRDGANPNHIESQFPAFVKKHMSSVLETYGIKTSFHLQRITDIHLHSNYEKEAQVNGSAREISYLAIIGIFVLLIAWVNYINLATARSVQRSKEVGLRKVIGAEKRQLFYQFITEAALLNFFSFCFSAVLVTLFLHFSENITGKDISTGFFISGLGSEPMFLPICLLIFVCGSLLIGFYPALIMSSTSPATILRGVASNSYRGISLRRVLVAFQFCMSLVLIGATSVVYKQLDFMQKQELGFDKNKVMVIKAPPVTRERLQQLAAMKPRMIKIPGVQDVSVSSEVPGENIRYQNLVRRSYQDRTSGVGTNLLEADDHFMSVLKIPLIAGRALSASDTMAWGRFLTTRIVINEMLAGLLGFTSADKAIGKKVILILGIDDLTCEIVGVVKNFHHKSLKAKYEPFLFYYPNITGWKYITLKLNAPAEKKSITQIEDIYRKQFPGDPFEYFFLDDYFSQQYSPERRLGKIFLLFSGLAILVACLGLIGLCSFIVRTRMKEIGIRKVLGASASNIVLIFSKDYMRLILIAALISVPLMYYATNSWLENFAFRFKMNAGIFILPIVLLSFISLLLTFIQTYAAAFANPTKLIRND